jgi:PAS domain S-box-containing protein
MHKSAVESQPEIILSLNEKPILIRVLYVDDEAEFLKLTRELLEMEGEFQIETALSVQEAFEKLNEKKFDAIVSDYMMPEKDGLALLKELREKGNNIPFIVFTGKGTEEVAKEALNLGADHYINKTGEPETVYSELAQSITKAVKIRESEQALRDREQRFRAIGDSAAEALVSIDAQGKIVFWNKMAEKISGYSADEMIGKSASDFVAPKDSLRAKELLKDILSQVNIRNAELTVLTKDGREFLAEVSASPILDSSGKPASIVVVTKGITESKKAAQSIRESQQKFERLFRENPEAAVYLSPDFHIRDINPRFTELFAYSLDEIKGKDINDVVVPSGKLEEAEMLDGKAEKGYVYYDTVRKKKDGSLVPVSVSAAPITVEGKLVGHVALYKDISELKRTEEALKETMEKLATMNEKLRVVGRLTRHDVRNKLSVVT